MNILGVDPGLSGAAVLLRVDSEAPIILACVDFTEYGRARRFDSVTLARELTPLARDAVLAVVEAPSAAPARKDDSGLRGGGQGVASAFTFGLSCGVPEGIIAVSLPRIYLIPPSVWKTSMGAPKDKKLAVAHAVKLFPAHANIFYGPRGGLKDGIAEAALLALFGMRFVPQKPRSKLI